MAHRVAAFYTFNDGLEHAELCVPAPPGTEPKLPPGTSPSPWVCDLTFAPGWNWSRVFDVATYTVGVGWNVAAAFSPPEAKCYVFMTDGTTIYWYRFGQNYTNMPNDPNPTGNIGSVSGGIIIDISAHFDGTHVQVAAVTNLGEVWLWSGSPDGAPLSPIGTQIYPQPKSISIFAGAGWNHIIIATNNELSEIWFNNTGFGANPLWTFMNNSITDIGACYTPGDGLARIFCLTENNQIFEVFWTPAQVPAEAVLSATLNFSPNSLSAYTKNGAQHVIFSDESFDTYLSWFDPGSHEMKWGPFPPRTSW